MDSEGIRLPPKPTLEPQTTLFKSTQLDLTPEKKQPTNRLKENSQRSGFSSNVSTVNKLEQRKEIYSCLAQPSMNSTNLVSKKLAALQKEQFDPALAIAEEIEQSETTRVIFGEKVAQAVNVKKGSHIYADLIPLDVEAKDVLAECAYPKARSSSKSTKLLTQEPDIMAFFSENFETQKAHLDYDLFYQGDPVNEPSAASISHVFDLHKHIQCWQE